MDSRLDKIAASRAEGVLALFTGTGDCGMRQAARDLAESVGAPLQTIDLATLVEKHLTEVETLIDAAFNTAGRSGAVLLFDEADALFGKRTSVRNSHDRYANLEVSYLLERAKGYRGIVILASNQPDNIDPALVRQCAFALAFPEDRCS